MVSLLIVKVKSGWIAGQGITSRRKNSDGPVCLVGGKAMLCCQICPEADELARSALFGPSVKPTKSIDRQVIKPLLIQTQTLFTVTHFWRKNELQVDAKAVAISKATVRLSLKLISVATLVGFGEKRCRKNLPLCDH